jgi:hypothetical protein
MGYANGVNLLPATGEFTYGTTAHQGKRELSGAATVPGNFYQGLNSAFSPAATHAGMPPSVNITHAVSQLPINFPD